MKLEINFYLNIFFNDSKLRRKMNNLPILLLKCSFINV